MNSESRLANILVEGLLDKYPCDIGLMMAGALNASLCAGEIQWGHVHGACSTPTRPVLLTMYGSDIHAILEKALRPEYFLKRGLGFGFRGGIIGFMAVANAEVDFSVINRDPVVNAIRIGGQDLQPRKQYRVVTCEYLWLSPVFEEFHRGQEVHVQIPLVREVLRDALSKPHVLRKAEQRHYHLLHP
jgi:5'-nucleotidase